MAKYTRFINNEQWKLLKTLLPEPRKSPKGGRPPADNREVLEGILWILRTGARWQDLPEQYPSPSTCWRRLRLWEEQGVWLDVWRKFLSMLDEKGLLDWEEAFIDGSFAPAKKGALASGKPKKGKGTKWMVVVDGQGIPLGSTLASASPSEFKLAEETLETVKVPRAGRGRPKKRPLRLIADRGYDSDPLRKRLKVFKIDLIVPHRKNRKRPKTQDGRKLRRYRKRWIVERTFAWLGNYRRLLVRHERRIDMYRAFFHLACIMIVLNRF
ncbi:MAG: IS5 family transposase [Desulfobacterales bacterium]|nr:IS5 family transposase [Desulfobacterales bacterium]